MEVGHGSYSNVFADGDKVIKVLKPWALELKHPEDRIRIAREIACLQHLRHPNIVRLLEVLPDPLALVLERTDFDLQQVLDGGDPLTEAHVQFIFYQLVCAVQVCHAADLMHRDLKPANVLINKDCVVKLCDFNLAANYKGRRLSLGVVSLPYRAPELILQQAYTMAIDVWSLGCILAELLLATRARPSPLFLVPPTSPTNHVIIIGNVLLTLEYTFAFASPHARDLLARLLQFDPARRPAVQDIAAHPFFDTMHPARRQPCPIPTPCDLRPIDTHVDAFLAGLQGNA